MLRNIPACISPDLMHALMSMGHGDEIVLADANFPGASNSKAQMLKEIFTPWDRKAYPTGQE